MATVVDLKTEVIHRYVYELRFDFGQVYWDRAGRIAKQILSEREEWDFERIDINHCQLTHRDLNLAFNFGHAKLDLSQTQNAETETLLPVGDFGAFADTFTASVVENLELEFFPRIGFRVWHLYPSADREQSHEIVRNLKLFGLDSNLSSAIGELSEVSHRLVADRPKHMVRIAIAPFEQQIDLPPSIVRATKQKSHKQPKNQQRVLIDKLKAEKTIAHYPQFGVLLDLDAYIEEPPFPDGLSVSDFIASAFEDFTELKQTVLTAANSN